MTQALSLPRWKIWIIAARPRTLIASISPVVIGTLFAYSQGVFNPLLFFFTLLASICIQIGTNLANDYFDFLKGADTAERQGPLRVTQAGLLSKEEIRKGFIIIFGLSAICSTYLVLHGGVIIAALAGLAILLGIIYTAGPCPIAYIGLGELFVFFFFGPIATAGTFFLQIKAFSFQGLLLGIAPGALSSCILIVNNLRDVQQDRKANKKTLVVRWGKTFGQLEFVVFHLLALSTPLFFIKHYPLIGWISALLCFPVVRLIFSLFRIERATQYNALLKQSALFLVLYTLFFSIGLIF